VALNYNELLSTTLSIYRKTLEDNIMSANPLFYWLSAKGRKKELSGGNKIVVPLRYGLNETVKSYEGYDTLDVTPQTGISAAEFNWKQIAGSVSISGAEERKNAGESKIIDLLRAKIEQCEDSMIENLDEMAFGDGTGNDSKNILGLKAIVAVAPTTGTLGGINRADYSWWRNQYDATGYSAWGGASDTAIAAMREMYNKASKGNIHPDLILTTRSIFGKYEGACALNERFTSTAVADAGFENLKFKGAVIMFDEYCTTAYMYFLNSRYLNWTVHSACDFLNTPFIRPENYDARVSQVLVMGNLVVSNCKQQGILSALT